ncbi:MAG: hypothetical protein HWE22_07960 [Flavobacteriales bacterium]|nr:hypothetical protein [Flavobacteriales bacterium]
MNSRLLLIVTFLFLTIDLSSQVELKAEGALFKSITPWNQGYLGMVVSKLSYADLSKGIASKSGAFQYFNSRGEMEWKKKVNTFNFNNVHICNDDSDYFYFINMPFSKVGFSMSEQTSKTKFLTIYQFNREGKIVEKSIDYSGVLSPLKDYVENLNQCYVAALKDGFVIVVSNDNKKHHIVRVRDNFEVDYTSVDFEWDDEKWAEGQLSKIKFTTSENEISLIQIEVESSELTMNLKSFDLDEISEFKEVTNTLDFSGYSLISKDLSSELLYSSRDRVFTLYAESPLHPVLRLGSIVDFIETKEGLKACFHYRNLKEGTRRKIDKEGFLLYDIGASSSTQKVDFAFSVGESASSSCKFVFSEDGEFVVVTKQSKKNFVVKSSGGKEMTLRGNLKMAEAYLLFIRGEKDSKFDGINYVTLSKGKYYGIKYEGRSDLVGNFGRAVIYQH